MKEFFYNVDAFFNLPIVQVISSLILIAFGVHIIFRTYKVLKKPAIDLYDKDNLASIAFGLSCAIDEYQDHFPDDELLLNEHYVKIRKLHREVCKMIGEDEEGRKLSCSK